MDGALIFNITIVLLVLLVITMLASIFPGGAVRIDKGIK